MTFRGIKPPWHATICPPCCLFTHRPILRLRQIGQQGKSTGRRHLIDCTDNKMSYFRARRRGKALTDHVQNRRPAHASNSDSSYSSLSSNSSPNHAWIPYSRCTAGRAAYRARQTTQSIACSMDESWHIEGALPSQEGLASQRKRLGACDHSSHGLL